MNSNNTVYILNNRVDFFWLAIYRGILTVICCSNQWSTSISHAYSLPDSLTVFVHVIHVISVYNNLFSQSLH